jgi:hypothetical protein
MREYQRVKKEFQLLQKLPKRWKKVVHNNLPSMIGGQCLYVISATESHSINFIPQHKLHSGRKVTASFVDR